MDESLVPNWKAVGHTDGPFTPVGVLGHHTAGGSSGNLPSFNTVRYGRPGLEGPLAQLMLARNGVWVPIAAGRAWHAGGADNPARWPWVPRGDGNGYLIGIEAESTGTSDDWTPEQRASYPLGVAALLRHMGVGADRFLGHKEWAPSRKIDPAFWDLNQFRGTVAGHLGGPTPSPVIVPASDVTPLPADASTFGLPGGHYWGLLSGPAESHGGINDWEKAHVRRIQQALQARGYAPSYAGWADGVYEAPTADAVAAFQHREMPGTTRFGEVWADDWAVLVDGHAAAPSIPPVPGLPAWSLPRGHYYGLITGPAQSHGGINAAERTAVQAIQRRLIAKGYVPGVTDWRSGWADGRYEQATADAVTRFQRREMPGTTFYGQVWADDYARLGR